MKHKKPRIGKKYQAKILQLMTNIDKSKIEFRGERLTNNQVISKDYSIKQRMQILYNIVTRYLDLIEN